MSQKVKIPSPCVDICKDKHGVCVACGRTKKDEKAWKRAETANEKFDLLRQCVVKTEELGTRQFWEKEYRRKCAKKDIPCPLDNAYSAFSELSPRQTTLN